MQFNVLSLARALASLDEDQANLAVRFSKELRGRKPGRKAKGEKKVVRRRRKKQQAEGEGEEA